MIFATSRTDRAKPECDVTMGQYPGGPALAEAGDSGLTTRGILRGWRTIETEKQQELRVIY